MTGSWRGWLMTVLLAGMVLAGTGQGPAVSGTNGQQPSQPLAAAGQVTLVEISGGTCVPCALSDQIIRDLHARYGQRLRLVRLDVHRDAALVKQFDLKAIPALIFYDSRARVQYRRNGLMNEDEVVEILDMLLAK